MTVRRILSILILLGFTPAIPLSASGCVIADGKNVVVIQCSNISNTCTIKVNGHPSGVVTHEAAAVLCDS